MKICSVCRFPKDETDFHKNAGRSSGYQNRCKTCDSEYGKDHYAKNKQAYLESNLRRKKEVAAWVRAYKEAHDCKDCQQHYPYYVMDFDHVRGVKKMDISKMVNSARGLGVIREEIAKCDLVCANCHRMRTFTRRDIPG